MGPGQGKGGEVEKTEATEGGMWKVGKKEKKREKMREKREEPFKGADRVARTAR